MQDWAKHADEKSSGSVFRALLHECEREPDPRASTQSALGLFPCASRSLENRGEGNICGTHLQKRDAAHLAVRWLTQSLCTADFIKEKQETNRT